ncbi:acetyltransferase [Rhodoferax sp.]|uniref:acetyltransferase n=1 Tax=Rhodoferax sp. TaxID=50421 RepID=UPI00260EDEAB|nr:acetyltransferase [Rhodoferax sp.]MDD2919867.1 acetyltransferase [Rhodoferax sp.]
MFEISDRTIILFGAGGHAKSVISVLQAQAKWQLAGLLEEGDRENEKRVLGYPVLGGMDELDLFRQKGITKAMVCIGSNRARARVSALLIARGFELVSIVHPTSSLMTDCVVGKGSFLHAQSLIGAECQVGLNTIVQPFTSLGHEGRIGDCVQFCPGTHIGGKVTIGDLCFFGPGAVVYPHITIGRNVSVGANAVVDKNVPDDAVVVGNPGQIVHYKSHKPQTRHQIEI